MPVSIKRPLSIRIALCCNTFPAFAGITNIGIIISRSNNFAIILKISGGKPEMWSQYQKNTLTTYFNELPKSSVLCRIKTIFPITA